MPRPRVRWIARVLVPLLMIGGVVALLLTAAWQHVVPVPTVHVESAVVKQIGVVAPAQAVVQAAGWIEPYPHPHHISGLSGGTITEILALEGDAVSAGQVVARLDSREAELAVAEQQAALADAQGRRAEVVARLRAAEDGWKHPVALEAGVAVAKARLSENQATAAEVEARIEEQRVQLAQALRDADRAEALARKEVTSDREAEQERAESAAAAAALTALERRLEAVRGMRERLAAELAAGERELELRIVDRRDVEVARAVLERAEAAVRLAQTALDQATLTRERMEIVADRDGIVMRRHKETGDTLMPKMEGKYSGVVLTIYDPAQLQARVDVPLADAGKIAVGQRCEVVTDVLPDQRFAGRVLRTLHQADISKNTLQVKVSIEVPDAALRPDMLCRVRFLAEPRTTAEEGERAAYAFVPARAVSNGTLWLAREVEGRRARAEPRAAGIVAEEADWVAVEGLRAGALVITDPPANLRAGARVQLAETEASP